MHAETESLALKELEELASSSDQPYPKAAIPLSRESDGPLAGNLWQPTGVSFTVEFRERLVASRTDAMLIF